jgi:hypothetical protein
VKPVIFALAALVIAGPGPTRAAEPPQRPYSCLLLDDAERKCAFVTRDQRLILGQCDSLERTRLRKECLRDWGRP